MHTLLAIETSGQSLGVALHDERGVVFEENVTAGMIHGRALAPLMQRALGCSPLAPERGEGPGGEGRATDRRDPSPPTPPPGGGRGVTAVAVSVGPGSWTGLRIGISAAKAFAWAAGIQLVSVPSFEALALEAAQRAPGDAILTLRDARSEGFFAALFIETSGGLRRCIPECVVKPEEIAAAVEQVLPSRAREQAVTTAPLRSRLGNIAVCGDAKCLDALSGTAKKLGWTLLTELAHIPARATARCGWQRLQRGEGVLTTAAEIHKLTPLYLRASDPELKLRGSGIRVQGSGV